MNINENHLESLSFLEVKVFNKPIKDSKVWTFIKEFFINKDHEFINALYEDFIMMNDPLFDPNKLSNQYNLLDIEFSSRFGDSSLSDYNLEVIMMTVNELVKLSKIESES